MTITDRVLSLDPALKTGVHPAGSRWHWFDPTDIPQIHFPEGIEAEVGEFVYGLVRLLGPRRILETGTRLGISTRYMALAMIDNGEGGTIDTMERDTFVWGLAIQKLEQAGCFGPPTIVRCWRSDFKDFTPTGTYDMLWLDTEPCYRFGELVRLWPFLADGGIVCIHDLPQFNCPPYGPMPFEMQQWLATGQLVAMHFKTATGLTVMQKRQARA